MAVARAAVRLVLLDDRERVFPPPLWATVYSSLQALKGHVQEYPGCQSFDVFVRAEGDGDVLVHCYTTWDTAGQLEVFLERGYTFERLLARHRLGAQHRRGAS